MKFTSIFFTASASIFEVQLKDNNKRARNIKLAWIFFIASESINQPWDRMCQCDAAF